jgi:HNH endonuclease
MKQEYLDSFDREVTCTYRGETYHVRDNGAVFRLRGDRARPRKLDEKWTFGRADKNTGYMFVLNVGTHLIVATAFHGPKPSKDLVVDHIDTNKRNNRPENLRWVTRLENLLLNPITRRRIEIAYGSIEDFLADPKNPISGKLDSRFEWMRSVTKKEAEESHKRLLDWAKSGGMPSGGTLGEWLYRSRSEQHVEEPEPDDLTESRTPGAIQKNWKTPSEFPLCPSDIVGNALDEYRERLKKGEVFSRNDFGESRVELAELSKDSETIVVLCRHPGGVKDWALAQVSVEDQLFVHEALGTFFELQGATKQYTLARGLEWEGGDSIDDYC